MKGFIVKKKKYKLNLNDKRLTILSKFDQRIRKLEKNLKKNKIKNLKTSKDIKKSLKRLKKSMNSCDINRAVRKSLES